MVRNPPTVIAGCADRPRMLCRGAAVGGRRAQPVERRMAAWLGLGWWLVCLALAAGARGFGFEAAEASRVDEYQIKAALLAKLPLFVQWPASQSEDKLVVGVLGENALYKHLMGMPGLVIGGKKLEIKKCLGVEDAAACQIVFVGASEAGRLPGLLSRNANASILTVGEQSSFIEHGGVMALVADKRNVHLEINVEAARKAGLRIDPQLLQMARVVRGAPRREAQP